MTLATTVSGANLTKIRSDDYQAQQFVVSVPDVIVVQFQPSIAPTQSVYAEISVGSIASGSMSNIKSNQTVIYSTSTDYLNTAFEFKTYVRKVNGTTTLYVGQTGQSLITAYYVTVLNTYDMVEKPGIDRNGTFYANWDVTFRRLLPVESDLATAYILIDGETAFSETANPQAIDNDATTSFTHAWESSNSSDTLDSGGTTANPSWTLQANAHRWIRYTFTDSNGNANLRVISVWTVPKDLSSVVNLGFIGQSNNVANISYQIGAGWQCTVPAVSGISTMRKGVLCCVFSIEDYNATRGSIESNIDFVGYLGIEVTNTGGSPEFGAISETAFNIIGMGAKLADTPVPLLAITSDSTPTEWGDIENPTPVRVLAYILSEYTTFLHLCAFKFSTTHTNYIAPSDIFRSESDIASESAQYQADAMGGILQYSRNGIFDVSVNLVESSTTVRDAAPVVAAMTSVDWLKFDIERNPDLLVRFLLVGAGVFDTSSGQYSVYQAVVPPIADIRGVSSEQRPNMILTTNLSLSNAIIEMAQRSANLYAALNPTDIIRVTLKDEWRFLQPDVGAWYTFEVAASATVRGIVYDSNTRWQLIDISYTSNNETGRKEVQATFRRETSSTGANVEVTPVKNNVLNNINAVPATLPPWSGGDLGLTDGLDFSSFDTSPSTDPSPPGAGCELIGFRPKDGLGAQTIESAGSGQAISVAVRGNGILDGGGDVTEDFSSAAGVWISFITSDASPLGGTIASGQTGTHSGGTGWVAGSFTNNPGATTHRGVIIQLDLGTTKTITDFKIYYDLTKGTSNTSGDDASRMSIVQSDATEVILAGLNFGELTNGSGQTMRYQDDVGTQGRYLRIRMLSTMFGASPTGSVTISRVDYTIKTAYGDALYQWTIDSDPVAYGSGDGLLIDLLQPTSIPPYSDAHTYEIYETPAPQTGPVILDFESPHGIGAMENWGIQAEVCFL